MPNPRMLSLTLASNATAYRLLDLLQAADPSYKNLHSLTAAQCAIQFDVNAGGARLYFGNADVSSTNRGAELVAGQVWPAASWPSLGNNLYLGDVWLKSNANSAVINLTLAVK